MRHLIGLCCCLLLVVPAVLLFGLPVTFTGEAAFWLAMVGVGNVTGLVLEGLSAARLNPSGDCTTLRAAGA